MLAICSQFARAFTVSTEKCKVIANEVKYMLEHSLTEPSDSVTKPDAYPLPQIEDCVSQVDSAKFVSKFDLLKRYWQVPLSRRAKDISTFITPFGLIPYS